MTSIIAEKLAAKANTIQSFSGALRPGAVALVPKLRDNPKAKALMEELRTGKRRFKEVKAEFERTLNEKNPFFPTNTQYWNVYPSDLEGGSAALEKLLELYGEMRGQDTVKRLYRVPVVFSDAGGIERIFPSEFAMKGPQQPAYRSQETANGRKCVYIRPVTEQSARIANIPNRKKHFPRELVERGECSPENCKEYALASCKFFGTLMFHVPEMEGAHPYRMSFNSDYAATEIWERLQSILEIFGGRLPKYDPQGRPVFFLTKKVVTRSFFGPGENGGQLVRKQVEQWVPHLETSLIMSRVLQMQERGQPLLGHDDTASLQAALLPGTPTAWVDDPAETTRKDTQAQTMVEADRPTAMTPLQKLMRFAVEYGIAEALQDYAAVRYGDGWDEAPAKIDALSDELGSMSRSRSADCLRAMLRFCTVGFREGLDMKNVVTPYMRKLFQNGFTNDAATLDRAVAELEELVVDGPEVAMAYMKSQLEMPQAA